MKKIKLISFIITLILIALIVFFILQNKQVPQEKIVVVGNTQVLSEIDHLLLPVGSWNATENDFNQLKNLTKDDEYASEEVNKLAILTKYREYAHAGHGLASLHDYVKTGNESICPGHALSHYYVFMKHNETQFAQGVFQEAEDQYPQWIEIKEKQTQKNKSQQKYPYYKTLFNQTITDINEGNNNMTGQTLSILTQAPCAK